MVLGERSAGLVPEDDDESDFGDSSEADQGPDQPWTGKGAVKELTQLVRVYATGGLAPRRSGNVQLILGSTSLAAHQGTSTGQLPLLRGGTDTRRYDVSHASWSLLRVERGRKRELGSRC